MSENELTNKVRELEKTIADLHDQIAYEQQRTLNNSMAADVELSVVTQERDVAVADNAALVEGLRKAIYTAQSGIPYSSCTKPFCAPLESLAKILDKNPAGADILARHAAELAAKDVEISQLREFLNQEHDALDQEHREYDRAMAERDQFESQLAASRTVAQTKHYSLQAVKADLSLAHEETKQAQAINEMRDKLIDELKALLLEATPPVDDWWCPTCKEALSGSRVTYQERCDTCGTYLGYETPEWISNARAALNPMQPKEIK